MMNNNFISYYEMDLANIYQKYDLEYDAYLEVQIELQEILDKYGEDVLN